MLTLILMIECGVRLGILTHQQFVPAWIQIATGTQTGQDLVPLTIHALRLTTALQAGVIEIFITFYENFSYWTSKVFSESETRQAGEVLKDIRPQAYADVHAYSQYWMFPYGFKSDRCQSYDKLMEMSKEIVDAIQSVHRTKFVYGPINEVSLSSKLGRLTIFFVCYLN